MVLLFVIAALVAPADSAASPAQPAVAGAELNSRLAAARQLVDRIHPTDQMIEMNVRSWEAVVRRNAASDQAMAKLEAEYPGVIEASMKAGRPVAVEFSVNFVRDAKTTKSRILAEQLSVAEMEEIGRFFDTPAGARFLSQFTQKADVDELAAQLSNGSPEEAAADNARDAVEKTMQSTLAGVISETSADDVIEIMKFEAKPVAKKFAAAGKAADELLLKILLNPDPDIGVRYRQAATAGALAHVESMRSGASKR